jgi:ATP-dependent DNA ligase
MTSTSAAGAADAQSEQQGVTLTLPVLPPLSPMLAKAVKDLPLPAAYPGGLGYEPKWDGFRCIVFRDGDDVELASRNERPLTRYFPEIVAAVQRELPPRCVIDGEIVLRRGPVLDFEALQERIHPADSRVRLLAEQTPASFVAFDVLAVEDESLISEPFGIRRARLRDMLAHSRAPIHITPMTDSPDVARRWFAEFEGAGLDGVVAKPLDEPYQPAKRVMFKIKHERTADCVVAGYRWHKSGPVVGSLLLGLFDGGRLQHVGVAASFPMKRRAELVDELAPLRLDDVAEHPWAAWAEQTEPGRGRMPGAPSRWSGKKDLSWVPLRPERVVEVGYDHMEGRRFRHTAQFRRWRLDRDAASCTYEQLEVPVSYDLDQIFG